MRRARFFSLLASPASSRCLPPALLRILRGRLTVIGPFGYTGSSLTHANGAHSGPPCWGEDASEEEIDTFYNPSKTAEELFDDFGDDTASVSVAKTRRVTRAGPHSGGSEGRGEALSVDSAAAESKGTDSSPGSQGTVESSGAAENPMAKEPEAESAVHPYYASIPLEDLVEAVTSYLRSGENANLIDKNEEDQLFPALLARFDDCSVPQLLDVVECPWRNSTMQRYGTVFKDLVRDRILLEAEELEPDLLHRSIIVMGISAGHRRRDLDFFKVLGKLLVLNINHYKDPNDLVRVMTAFNRAKIVPPKSFLALMGRRFPVLNKKHPLRALPAYRVFANLYRMGHDQMNPFRYLADRMFETIFANLKKEKIRLKKMERAAQSGDKSLIERTRIELERERTADLISAVKATKEEDAFDLSAIEAEDEEKWGGAEHNAAMVRRRFLELAEVRPLHLTKMLMILARFGAPHQQYLRPLLRPLLIPSIPHLPPPSLSRVIKAVRLFKSTDSIVYDAIIDHFIELGPERVIMADLLEMLRALAHPDVPVPPKTEGFLHLCYSVLTREDRLRARDMCVVASDLLLFSKKEDVSLPSLDTMYHLVEVFARRMTFLMELGVLSLTHAEIIEDIARQLKHADESGSIAAMRERRREINRVGDEEYYERLDIDVRETFFKLLFMDNINTYGPWRPIPGILQVDFKQSLTEVRVDYILEAVDLYNRAYPGQLRITLQRLLSRAVLMKLSDEGEEVIEEGRMILRPNTPIAFTAERVDMLAELLLRTPLKRVRRSLRTWAYLKLAADRVGADEAAQIAERRLTEVQAAYKAGHCRSEIERETPLDDASLDSAGNIADGRAIA